MNGKIVSLIDLYKGDRDVFLRQLRGQKELLHKIPEARQLETYDHFIQASDVDARRGERAIQLGQVGVILLAGGVGSRLKFDQPKGCFLLDGKKSLYEYAIEKVQGGGANVPLAIMTSEVTDRETRRFFEERKFFGLQQSQVDFFCQKNWPLLDEKGELFLEGPGQLALGPNGNGEAISLFAETPIFEKWKKLGIMHLALFSVDNPLAQPLYPPFVSHHISAEAEMTLLVTKKLSPEEKMGVLGRVKGKLTVIEYSELSASQRNEFLYGNTGIMLFSMDFVQKVKGIELPMHVARKSNKKYFQGMFIEITAYKFEQFIFDLLDFSERSEALVCERSLCFAPLKEREGPDGVVSVLKRVKGG